MTDTTGKEALTRMVQVPVVGRVETPSLEITHIFNQRIHARGGPVERRRSN